MARSAPPPCAQSVVIVGRLTSSRRTQQALLRSAEGPAAPLPRRARIRGGVAMRRGVAAGPTAPSSSPQAAHAVRGGALERLRT